MTPKQLMTWRFGHEYCIDYDPKAAAIRAGWSKESAQQAAYRLLKKPEVQQIIKEHKASVRASCIIKRDLVIEQLKVIAFSNLRDYLAMKANGSLRYKTKEEIRGPEATAVKLLQSNVKGETVRLELQDKIEALMKLEGLSRPPDETPKI